MFDQRCVDTCGGRCNIILLKVTDGFIGGVLMAGICLVGVVSHSSFMWNTWLYDDHLCECVGNVVVAGYVLCHCQSTGSVLEWPFDLAFPRGSRDACFADAFEIASTVAPWRGLSEGFLSCH